MRIRHAVKKKNMKKIKYNFINILVMLVTVVWFSTGYCDFGVSLFFGTDIWHVGIVVVIVFVVHMIKAMRLYLALYGSGIPAKEYLKIYCKVTPVSVVLPYKTGELFRIYCYGKTLNSLFRGCVIVLFDRFVDTIALVTMIILMYIYGGEITNLVYVLLLFLVFSLILYYVFPGVYRFWKIYILREKATEKNLHILGALEFINNIYSEITNVAKGRGLILFLMSLAAWGIEIVGIVLSYGINWYGNLNQVISNYLLAAIGNGKSIELSRFVFVSVIMTIAMYIWIKFIERIQRKKA